MANRQLIAFAVVVSLALAVVEARNFHAVSGGQRPWAGAPPRQQSGPALSGGNPFLKRLKQIVFQPDRLYDPSMEKFAFGDVFDADE